MNAPRKKRGSERGNAPSHTDAPFDTTTRQAMHNEDPHTQERKHDVRPVHHRARIWINNSDDRTEEFNSRERDAGGEQRNGEEERCDTRGFRARIDAREHIAPVQHTENDRWNHDQTSKHKVRKEVPEVKLILIRHPARPFEERDRREVDAVHRQQREQQKNAREKRL